MDGVFAVRDGGDVREKSECRMSKSEGGPKPEFRGRSLAVSVRISDFEVWISRAAGVVAERAFVACLCVTARGQAQRLARVNVAFDDEVGVGQNGFQLAQNVFRPKRVLLQRINLLKSLQQCRR